MKQSYVTRNNYAPSHPEVNSGEVLTVPDNGLTVDEIIVRFAKGRGVPSLEGMFDDQPDYSKSTIEELMMAHQSAQAEADRLEATANKMLKSVAQTELERKVQRKLDKKQPGQPGDAL